MEFKKCQKCGASWIDSQLFWSTGQKGKEEDLAGLVCNNLNPDDPDANLCINSKRGQDGGQTWDYRRGFADGLMAEWQRANEVKKNDN